MISDYVQVVDCKAWRDNEMLRLIDDGVLEMVSIRAKRKRKPKKPPLTERHVYLMRAGDHHKIGYAVLRRSDVTKYRSAARFPWNWYIALRLIITSV